MPYVGAGAPMWSGFWPAGGCPADARSCRGEQVPRAPGSSRRSWCFGRVAHLRPSGGIGFLGPPICGTSVAHRGPDHHERPEQARDASTPRTGAGARARSPDWRRQGRKRGPVPSQRWTVARTREAVLRFLRGLPAPLIRPPRTLAGIRPTPAPSDGPAYNRSTRPNVQASKAKHPMDHSLPHATNLSFDCLPVRRSMAILHTRIAPRSSRVNGHARPE